MNTPYLSKWSSLILLHEPDSKAVFPVFLHRRTESGPGQKMMYNLSESGEDNQWTDNALAIMTQHRPDLHTACNNQQ